MSAGFESRRDPRHFRGDVVETLNVLQRQGAIVRYQLPPRERGSLEVPRIAVQLPDGTASEALLARVREALQALPHFADLGGEVEADGRVG